MTGINEFYRNTLNQKLKNPMSWGAVLPNNIVALNVWLEEIVNGKAYVHSDKPSLTIAGHVNPNWIERKKHLDLIKSGVPAVGVLITNGNKSNDDKWRIHGFDESSIFKLNQLECNNNGEWVMRIDLTNPIKIKKVQFDGKAAISTIAKRHTIAIETVQKAIGIGWKLIGMTEDVATLTYYGKLMSVDLGDGSYTTRKG
ncbi:hypothetical protein [Shewanella sp. WPAGA9]|uniref:hypothetical protein n=1 Tax=Shewanella sp. ENK2 TaxID=2775245 RepID=UPI001785E1F4|nr:hypothetical protein [Shewanella sp. WPAGA9]